MLLRVGLTIAFIATAGAGLATGMLRDAGSSAAPSRDWFASELESVGRHVAQQLALGQAQSDLNRQAQRILRGAEPTTATVPFIRYSLRVASSAQPTVEDLAAGRFQTSAVLRYRLPADPVTVGRTVDATFALGRTGWRLAALGDDGRELWDHETVQVVDSGRASVIGSTSLAARLPSLADQVERARSQVARFWTANWPARVVVVLPGQAQTMNPLIGNKSASRLPAVTTWERGPDGPVIRITANPVVFLGLPAIAQQIVLRHEITHVAQDALGARTAPIWLTEGLAEYVGYRGAGIPAAVVAGDALSQVRIGGVPASLPADREFAFDRGSGQRSLVYEQGWAACQMVSARYGEDRLIPFYQAVLKADGSGNARVDQAAKKVLGIDGETFVAQWQNWLLDNA